MPRHRHILVRGLGERSTDFDPPGMGNTRRPREVANRVAHARKLRGDLQAVAASLGATTAAQASGEVPVKQRGQPISITARIGEPLVVGSGGVDSRRMKVFSVRRSVRGEEPTGDHALVFLSSNSLAGFMERLKAYETWEEARASPRLNAATTEAKRPQDFWLFESAAEFRVPTLQDYWTDDPADFPKSSQPVQWEVWTRSSMDSSFRRAIAATGIEPVGRETRFLDVTVWTLAATRPALRRIIESSAAVVGLRGASMFVAEHSSLPAGQRLEEATRIAARIQAAPRRAPRVVVLDTGVARENPLLAASLPAARCHRLDGSWDEFDADGHGTKMAGVALFRDLSEAGPGTGPIRLEVGLESVAVFAPGSPIQIPARDAVERAVTLVERREHARVYCLAATAPGEARDGSPTSTSATLDKLAFGDGTNTRLFCIAVGNVSTSPTEPYQVDQYEGRNEDHGVQAPAQALNVLSVGGMTHKCAGAAHVAASGDLSPTSRTALAWSMPRPFKPDIVMEGGNHARDPGGTTSRPHVPDMVATTSRDFARRPITATGETSAAAAAAAGLAGRVAARYPAFRAETIRGLMVHSAVWTEAMLARQRQLARRAADADAWAQMMACYGWGVPDEERLFWSAANALTLVAEDELQPYKREPGKSATLREMKYFRLPWPDNALRAMGSTQVEMKCTLSYFVEPDPHSAARDHFDRYASHRLRFDFQRYEESDLAAQRRLNLAIAAGVEPSVADDPGWLLGGRHKARGTIHQDVWRGPAYMLEGRRGVSVAPIRGWWGDRPALLPEERTVRFSLIASIRTPETANDIWNEVAVGIPAAIRVDVPSVVSV